MTSSPARQGSKRQKKPDILAGLQSEVLSGGAGEQIRTADVLLGKQAF